MPPHDALHRTLAANAASGHSRLSGHSCLLVDVRFDPKATKMLRCREVTQSANNGSN
jgi:hypothetical protein